MSGERLNSDSEDSEDSDDDEESERNGVDQTEVGILGQVPRRNGCDDTVFCANCTPTFVRPFYRFCRRVCPKFEIMPRPGCRSNTSYYRSRFHVLAFKKCEALCAFCANAKPTRIILPSLQNYFLLYTLLPSIIIKPATQCSSFPTKHWWNDSEDADDFVDDCNGRLVSALSQLGPPPRARDLGKLQLRPDDALTALE